MKEQLLAMLSDEQRAYAADLGASQTSPLGERIHELFKVLDDPLLTVDDVAELLGPENKSSDIRQILLSLLQDGVLEVSSATQRPLDKENVELYRLSEVQFRRLKLLALQSALPDGNSRLQFSIDGRIVRSIARVDRLDAVSGTGQQRSEIERHVRKIAQGIRAGTQIPNAILLVLLEENTIEANGEDEIPESFIVIRPLQEYADVELPDIATQTVQRVRLVELDLPYRRACFDDEKSILVVDGQQRTAAISLVSVDDVPSIDISVNAAIANENDAKSVFQIANDTVKIAAEFSRALLASMPESPGYLKSERLLAEATRILAIKDPESPFYGLVRYPGANAEKPIIAYNSLFSIVSIFNEGLLKGYFDDASALAMFISRAFTIIKKMWPDSWGQKPSESRLMHGAGLRSMATLIVRKIEARIESGGDPADQAVWNELSASITRLRARIVWSDAEASSASRLAQKYWREEISVRQNTNQDITALTNFLRKESLALDTESKRGSKTA